MYIIDNVNTKAAKIAIAEDKPYYSQKVDEVQDFLSYS